MADEDHRRRAQKALAKIRSEHFKPSYSSRPLNLEHSDRCSNRALFNGAISLIIFAAALGTKKRMGLLNNTSVIVLP